MNKNNNFKIIVLMIVLIFLLNSSLTAENLQKTNSEISIVILGDLMIHEEQLKSAYNKKTKSYNFDKSFRYIKNFLKKQDLVIANIEFTFGGKPFKGFPLFTSPESMAESLKNSGINCVVTANNHSYDMSSLGIKNTINVLNKYNIKHTGTFITKKDKRKNNPLIISKSGIKIALLNYTGFTNIPLKKKKYQVNIINEKVLVNDIKKAKNFNSDIIIVYFHWGKEYDSKITNYQKIISEICIENGVDIVVGTHPHVIQKMELNKKKDKTHFIAYSLGNFLSSQRNITSSGGAGLKIMVKKEKDRIYINNAGYFLSYVYSFLKKDKRYFTIIPSWYFNKISPKNIEFIRMKKFFSYHEKFLESKTKEINALNY